MRKRIVPFAVVLLLVVAACSSSDPTASDEYGALEQELAQAESQLTVVTTERDALVAEVEAATAVPDDVAALIEEWGNAINTGGGAVTGLYVPGGYHGSGGERIAYDEIATHLEAPLTPGEWTTEPYLLVDDDGDGRCVVARGALAAGAYPGSLTFLIARTPDGELQIVRSAWFPV
ncbi:MAG: hypothetical protein WCC01_03400 [Acidimicrobiia bacterium]